MKTIKHLLILGALLSLTLPTGCSREAADAFSGDGLISATFHLSLTDGMETKAISDGSLADELLFQVYDAGGNHLANMDQTVAVAEKKASVSAKLIRGQQYSFVFWAQKTGTYTLTDGKLAIANPTLVSMVNDDTFDAFYGTLTLQKDADFQENIVLSRPFAQINLAVPEADYAVVGTLPEGTIKTAFAVTGIHDQLNLLDGTLATTEGFTGTVDFELKNALAENLTIENTGYHWITTAYVLAPEDETTVDVTLKVSKLQNVDNPVNFSREIQSVPVKRNHRTNILCRVFSVNGAFGISMDPGFIQPDNNQ